jgi:very-short-patch-repair endonuclease
VAHSDTVEGPALRATRNSMQNARRQRRAMSPPEAKLWARLRRSPSGVRFRRQHPIGPYVADFYCPAAKLVIEIDGQIHGFEERLVRDAVRDEFMREAGLEVVRIAAADVFADADCVGAALIAKCAELIGPSTAQLR